MTKDLTLNWTKLLESCHFPAEPQVSPREWCWTTPSWPAVYIWPTTDSLDVPEILLTPRSMRNSSISSQSFPCFTYLASQWMSSSPSQQELTASPCQNLKLHYSFQCECKESIHLHSLTHNLNSLEKHQPFFMNLVPPLVMMLANHPAITKEKHLAGTRVVSSGGSPISALVLEKLWTKLHPDCEFKVIWNTCLMKDDNFIIS